MERWSSLQRVRRRACAALAAVSLLLGGCSSLNVLETWHNPAGTGHRYQKLLIVGIGHDENLRSLAENIIVDELGRNGVTAVASHTMVKEIDNAKRDDVVAAVRTVGADGVIAIRALAKGDTTVSRQGQSDGIYGTAMNSGGSLVPSAKDFALATLQTNLYDSASAELVWTATIKTFDAKDVARVSRELARFFVAQLRKDGLL